MFSGLILGSILLVLLLFFVIIPLYTRHGESVSVPQLNGKTLEEASALLAEHQLDLEVTDSVYNREFEPLLILSQDPPALSRVKPGRKVFLVVNKVVAPKVKMPDVENISLYQAKVRLENWGLEIGKITYKPFFAPVVMKVSLDGKELKAGEEINIGTRIDLVIGKIENERYVQVPDLMGLNIGNAIQIIQDLDLQLGKIKFNEDASETPGSVIKQYPKYVEEDSIKVGTVVDLFVAGKQPDEAPEQIISE